MRTKGAGSGNQRWRRGRDRYRPPDEPIRPYEYEVGALAGDAEAKAFVQAHHYAGTYPAARFRYGLYRFGRLVGVAVFSVPMNGRTITGTLPTADVQAGVELGRFVLLDGVPGNGETWFLARCFERLRREGLCGVVSFSDPMPRAGGAARWRSVGTIYQAHNARYVSRSAARTHLVFPGGEVLSPRALSKLSTGERGWRYAAEQLARHGTQSAGKGAGGTWLGKARVEDWLKEAVATGVLRRLRHPGNHKYAWGLTPAARSRLTPRRIPKGPRRSSTRSFEPARGRARSRGERPAALCGSPFLLFSDEPPRCL